MNFKHQSVGRLLAADQSKEPLMETGMYLYRDDGMPFPDDFKFIAHLVSSIGY